MSQSDNETCDPKAPTGLICLNAEARTASSRWPPKVMEPEMDFDPYESHRREW